MRKKYISFFPSFLPFPFLTCCAVIMTSFGGKGPHLRQWLVTQTLPIRQMPGDLCTVPSIISLSPLSLVTDVTLGVSGLWQGTLTGAGGTAKPAFLVTTYGFHIIFFLLLTSRSWRYIFQHNSKQFTYVKVITFSDFILIRNLREQFPKWVWRIGPWKKNQRKNL